MAEVVEGAVARRLEEVGLRRAGAVEPLAAAPQLEHHVLHELLGHRPVAHHRVRRPHQRRVPGAEDRVERRACLPLVGAAQAGEKITIRVGQWRWERVVAES